MLSTALYAQNGSIYNQNYVFGTTFTLNQTALNEIGLPVMTGSNVWSYLSSNLAVSLLYMQVYDSYNVPDWWHDYALYSFLGTIYCSLCQAILGKKSV